MSEIFERKGKGLLEVDFRGIGIKTDKHTIRESPLIFCNWFPTRFHHSWANIKELQAIKKRSVKQTTDIYDM